MKAPGAAGAAWPCGHKKCAWRSLVGATECGVAVESLRPAQNTLAGIVNAAEIRTLAERQMGEFLKQMPKAKGGWESRGPQAAPQDEPATLAEIGITKKQSTNAQKLADIPEPESRERAQKSGSLFLAQPSRLLNQHLGQKERPALHECRTRQRRDSRSRARSMRSRL